MNYEFREESAERKTFRGIFNKQVLPDSPINYKHQRRIFMVSAFMLSLDGNRMVGALIVVVFVIGGIGAASLVPHDRPNTSSRP